MESNSDHSGTFFGRHGTLFFERKGCRQSQTILFIHGLGGTTNTYNTIVPDLLDFDIVLFDWSGHGQSGTPPVTEVSTYVQDAQAVINHLDLHDVVVVGHSFGGLIALHLAATIPNEVKALVLFAPVNAPSDQGKAGIQARSNAITEGGMMAATDTIVRNAFSPVSFSRKRAEVTLAREMLLRQTPTGYVLALQALKNSSPPAWGLIRAKATIVRGEDDKVATDEVIQGIARGLGGLGKCILLPGIGHWPMLEAPESSVDILRTAVC